jgi:hypothetical protein
MASEAELIVRTLDRHLTAPGRIRLLGGAALILGYGRDRSTEDADLVMDDGEVQALIDHSGFSEAVTQTNEELANRGLYLTHIWGPEQQILTPTWRTECRRVALAPPLARLTVEVLGPLDLITSKLARGDDADLDDVMHLIRVESLSHDVVRAAVASAVVPEVLAEVFVGARARLVARLETKG